MYIEKSGIWTWFLQRITGLLVVIGIIIHFVTFHYTSDKGVQSYTSALNRLVSPFWIVFYLCLLATVISHGLIGVWNICIDYTLGDRTRSLIRCALYTVGIVTFGVGVYIIIWFIFKR